MHILLIGAGGREHALAWKLAQSPSTSRLSAAPGNPGIAQHAAIVDLNVDDFAAVAQFCIDQAVGLVVVGPEAPLVAGLADVLRGHAIPVFGPSAAAAMLEGSKGFVKQLCAQHGIPTAAFAQHDAVDAAIADLPRFGLPVVIKADGLAAGKGVIIANSAAEAEAAVRDMLGGGFGAAGASVVIEEFMVGEEVSLFALCDGATILPFGSAQDHKRVGDGDIGPNTGGMGAYSPAPCLTPVLETAAMDKIIRPTVAAMAAAGTPYVGVLYAGLMLTADGPKLVEYNCRFGDPECQVLLPRYTSDLAALLLAAATGGLAACDAPFAPDSAITIVLAAKGYPGTPQKGGAIHLPDGLPPHCQIFHAGTTRTGGVLVANGGRVLNVGAQAATLSHAQAAAYALVDRVDFADGFYRKDIGWRGVQ
ncbi:MAG: phosphoribosylamine--glycine ligase [Sphingomonadaceae bacterium]|nr:phosphoribosylamine--glycine ligase [Sphingomonadaceae bacterium]